MPQKGLILSKIEDYFHKNHAKENKKKVNKKKLHKEKKGREFIKESYFVGGKMKLCRIFIVDGIPADEFYLKNATDLDFYMNGDYELINS